jgi:CBS domain-containing protein
MEAKVSDVLRHKGDRVVTVMPQQTVAAAIQLLTKNRIGATPVVDEQGRVVGIVSERDIIRGLSENAGALLALPVDELMTREVKTCLPDDRLVDLMQVMTLQRIRHLPVVHNGALCGIVSIGDVVKQRLEEVQSDVEDLHRYIRSP